MANSMKKLGISIVVGLGVLGVGAAVGVNYATKQLKLQIEQALGKDSEIGSITLGWSAVEVNQLSIKAPAGWPAAETLKAKRIVVSPDWFALLSKNVAIKRIQVDEAYLSVLRAPNGKVRMLPSLLEKPKSDDKQPDTPVTIGRIALNNAMLDVFDATVRQPPHRTRLENVNVQLDHLNLPSLSGRSQLAIDGSVRGVVQNGTISVKGDIELATKESEITTKMRGVDLVALQPYLIKSANTGVKQGSLDLDIKSTIKQRRLSAPGVITLHKLELDSQGGFMGFPRQAAVGLLKDGKNDISIKFTLEGNLDDPKFSLNESLSTRFGAGLADSLGVSVGGLGKAVGGAASSVGGAIKGLFGK